jgi:hypothetical protein
MGCKKVQIGGFPVLKTLSQKSMQFSLLYTSFDPSQKKVLDLKKFYTTQLEMTHKESAPKKVLKESIVSGKPKFTRSSC